MRIILYSGKGGVGKTSLSAATAVRSAQLGRRTLVVSTDAAHSLADALQVPVGSAPTKVAPNLDALEIDVNRELSAHWGVVQDFITRFMTFQGVNDVVAEELAILPGMDELFSLLKVKRYAEQKAYDVIVIDTAPTGETIRMLAVPEVLNFYLKRIFPIQRTVLRSVRPVARRMTDMPIPSDDMLVAVQSILRQLEGMGPLLQDPKQTSIRIVLNPVRMVINESQRLYTYLNLFGFPVDAVVASTAGSTSRPATSCTRGRPSIRFRCSRRASSTARWSESSCWRPLPTTCSATPTPRTSSSARSPWRSRRRARATPSTSGCRSRRRTRSRSSPMARSSSSRWTISAATCCCPGPSPRGS